ncbi:MAG: carbonic anhydrase [Planctomycetota bacterium]
MFDLTSAAKGCGHQNVFSRRSLLGQTVLGAMCGVGGVAQFSLVRQGPFEQSGVKDHAQLSPDSPEAALEMLRAGNHRFAAGQSEARRDRERILQVSQQQKPFAAFLGCADSRVPIEIVFDQGFGDLFVTRIAGNVASSENIGSLEFGTLVLGAKVLYVLGHTNCGAVSATLKGEEVPGQISGLFQYIRPAVKTANGDLEKAITNNVRNQAILLAEASPVISRLIQRRELIVAGGIYDLATGKVSEVEITL